MQKFLIAILLLLSVFVDNSYSSCQDYSNHRCRRTCHRGEGNLHCHYNFKIEWKTTMNRNCGECPDKPEECVKPGCITGTGQRRAIITTNGLSPGPSIEVCKGDRINIVVENALFTGEAMAIHFHGIKQRHSPYMDGVPMITQCPQSVNTEFSISFDAEDAGTHFWYGTVGTQRADGLAGAFIVRDPYDPHAHLFDIDNHAPILLQNLVASATTSSSYFDYSDKTETEILINGRLASEDNPISKVKTPIFQMDPTCKHRFRIINAAFSQCAMKIDLASHSLRLLASDGHPLKTLTTKSLTIYPGERYDFVPVFNNTSEAESGPYKLNVVGDGKACNLKTAKAEMSYSHNVNPVIVEEGLVATEVTSNVRVLVPELVDNTTKEEDLIESLNYDGRIFRKTDFSMTIDLDSDETEDGEAKYRPRINGISFKPPSSPLISQPDQVTAKQFCNAAHRQCKIDSFCDCLHIVNFPLNSVVEILFVANDKYSLGIIHPIHVHGLNFHILSAGAVHANLSTQEVVALRANGSLSIKHNAALLKDSFTVPPGGYVLARFVANNPGVWMLESQSVYQSVKGMSMAISVGTRNDLPPIPNKWPLCGNWELTAKSDSFKVNSIRPTLFVVLIYTLKYLI